MHVFNEFSVKLWNLQPVQIFVYDCITEKTLTAMKFSYPDLQIIC